MVSLPLGFVVLVLSFVFAMDLTTWGAYVNKKALLIVLGGTVASAFYTTPTSVLKTLVASLRDLVARPSYDLKLTELQELETKRALGAPSRNKLLNDAAVLWEIGLAGDSFKSMLQNRRHELENGFADSVFALRSLAKYPPALGMVGTVIGLITLFSKLGDNSQEELGPALAVAMTATFFGLALANGLILPLADRLHIHHNALKRLHTHTFQSLVMIEDRQPLSYVLGALDGDLAQQAKRAPSVTLKGVPHEA